MEKDTVEVVLNSVARFVPGANGAVDLYVAPAYDDIASLYFEDDHWVLHYADRPDPMAPEALSKGSPSPTRKGPSARSSTEWRSIDWTTGVKRGRAISVDVRDEVHEVRKYRNYLVHERDELDPPDEVRINVARTRLNTLLHCLPVKW